MTHPELEGAVREVGFGPFRLVAQRKLLLRDGQSVAIGHRALDLLIALVNRAGDVVAPAELVAKVWPDRHVSEANLRTQVSLLRKALGDGDPGASSILNVAGRGYCFVSPVEPSAAVVPDTGPPLSTRETLPRRLTSVIGHATGIVAISEQVRTRRLVTIIGAGGIGKTTLAVAVAEMLAREFDSPPCFVDLGPLADGALAAGTVAAALGAPSSTNETGESLGNFLRDRHVLVVLDSCEPVIGAAAAIAEAILKSAPRAHILATSREPLRAEGEWTHRLPPMPVPPMGARMTASTAMEFPAVALFVKRAVASQDDFRLTDDNTALVAEICRRLEGIPLAIELAATRVAHLGLKDLANRLDERFVLLMRGRRTALPRHQTLRATMEWSYQLLSPGQQAVLHRLAAFRGTFTRDAALFIGAQEGQAEAEVLEDLGDLVDKSLVVLGPGGPEASYRLLDSMRAYLLGQGAEDGQVRGAAALAHARYFRDLLWRGRNEWEALDLGRASCSARRDLDNIRAALDWSFGPDGAVELGIDLTLTAIPIWLHFSLVMEGARYVRRAMEQLGPEEQADPVRSIPLLAALGEMLLHVASPEQDEVWRRLLHLAEESGDVARQIRALTGMALRAMTHSYEAAMQFALRVRALAKTAGPFEIAKGDRLVGYVQHILGDQPTARRAMEGLLAGYGRPVDRAHLARFNFDDSVGAKSTLAQVLWLQGEVDGAMRLANEAVEEAVALQHEYSLFFAAAFSACPIALLRGDLQGAAVAYAQLRGVLAEHSPRTLWATCFTGIAQMQRGEVEEGLGVLRQGFDAMPANSFGRDCPLFHTALAEGLIALGRGPEALETIEATLLRFRARGNRWFEPEFLRVRGCALLAAQGKAAAGAAEAACREALELARGQGALAWELRSATSLAHLMQHHGRGEAGRLLLAPVLGRFTEGPGTVDVVRGRALLAELGD